MAFLVKTGKWPFFQGRDWADFPDFSPKSRKTPKVYKQKFDPPFFFDSIERGRFLGAGGPHFNFGQNVGPKTCTQTKKVAPAGARQNRPL
jgi:hypothetical protein